MPNVQGFAELTGLSVAGASSEYTGLKVRRLIIGRKGHRIRVFDRERMDHVMHCRGVPQVP